MRSFPALVLLASLLTGCPEDPVVKPPTNPPQVFLTVDETNVIGKQVTGKINTTGCKNVTQLQLLQNDKFLTDVPFTKSPQAFTLPDGLFANLYPQLGIAASITLKAKVVCDDGRSNNSTPVGLKFFPIAQRYVPPEGSLLVPFAFVAEGGVGGSPATYIGCTATSNGSTIARVNNQGQVLAYVPSMPFDCSVGTQITDVATGSGYRWILEPGAGAFALKMSDFSIGKVLKNTKTRRLGMAPVSGIAMVWVDDSSTQPVQLRRLSPTTDASSDWSQNMLGIMNSTPTIVEGGPQPSVWISRFEFDLGNKLGTIVPYQYDLTTGAILNGVIDDGSGSGILQPSAILQQQYPMDVTSDPIIPEGYFAPNGEKFYIPLLSYQGTSANVQTTVLGCSTKPGLCEGANRVWTSENFPGLVTVVTAYTAANKLVAAGAYQAWFLNAQSGAVENLNARPITPVGSQVINALQPGLGTDFYILTAPLIGEGAGFSTEIICVDSPDRGELWRLTYGSGEAPLNALSMSIDVGGQPWIRVGTDLVKPLSNADYRTVRGPTP